MAKQKDRKPKINNLSAYFDAEKYFSLPPDKRNVAFDRFNFGISDLFKDGIKSLVSENELKELDKLNEDYRKRVKKLSPTILKKEFERLTIELSWKSSQIEGNTYSLIDTEILIKENKEAKGHKKEEAVMILNHKKALDYFLDKKSDFKKLTVSKIENVQKLIVRGLGIQAGIRKRPVGIVGTKYKPLDNEYQIKEAMGEMVDVVNNIDSPFLKALAVVLLVSYIQPFEDGNKRTARMLGDAVLLSYAFCPLSYRSVEESDYKKAVIVFYEQNSALLFKELFVEQFQFALNNYFL